MPTSSGVPTVKTALVAQLQLRSGLSGVQVSYGWLGLAQLGESITLDPPDDQAQPAGARIPTLKAGRKGREETFTVVASIQVARGGQNAAAAEATELRGFELLAEVDGLLADDPSLGGAVVGPTLRWDGVNYPRILTPFEAGWFCRIDAAYEFHLRLS